MGDDQPTELLRPMEEVEEYCKAHGVQIHNRKLGCHPVWPETVPNARGRFVKRFLQYLHRARVTGKNFVLVTHGDAVASTLTVMPPMEAKLVNQVSFCGFFVAASSDLRAPAETADTDEDTLLPTSSSSPNKLHDPQGWHMLLHGIKVGKVEEPRPFRFLRWSRKTGFDEQRMMKLLRCLPHPGRLEQPGKQRDGPLTATSLHRTASPCSSNSEMSFGASTAAFGGLSAGSSPSKDYAHYKPDLSPIMSANNTPIRQYVLNTDKALTMIQNLSNEGDGDVKSTEMIETNSRSRSSSGTVLSDSSPTFLQRRLRISL